MSSKRVGVALLYHGVCDQTSFSPDALVQDTPVSTLDAHAGYLRRHHDVVVASGLQPAVAGRRRGRRTPAAITFDDDHASYVPLALPVLERHRLPATFFLNAASIAEPCWFQWERLQAAWDHGLMDTLLERMPEPVGVAAAEATERPLVAISLALTDLPRAVRDGVERMLENEVHPELMPARMTLCDIETLAEAGHEIGFHTRRHEHLTELSDAELDVAMRDGREDLEAIIGAAVTTMAYPFGDWDARVARAAKRAGFSCAYTVDRFAVGNGSDPFALSRVTRPLGGGPCVSYVIARALTGTDWRGGPALLGPTAATLSPDAASWGSSLATMPIF